jgi:hypothetical protein
VIPLQECINTFYPGFERWKPSQNIPTMTTAEKEIQLIPEEAREQRDEDDLFKNLFKIFSVIKQEMQALPWNGSS